MVFLQRIFVLIFGLFSLVIFFKGFWESTKKKNAYGETPFLVLMGIFVWGDAVVFGLFWFFSSWLTLLLNNWILFCLIFSVFWVVRSLGETVFWFNQQFSSIKRYPPETLRGYRFFKNDAIWFVYQIICQCVTIISLITSLYLAKLWLKTV